MSTLLTDLRHAVRTLRKSPGFTVVAAVTLALGIGACTAIFSVVHAVLLRPLPYSDAERLVIVWGELRARGVNDWPFSPPDFRSLETETTVFEDLAGLTPANWNSLGGDDGEPEQIRSAATTPNLFRLLGARIAVGRDFTEADASPIAPPAEGQPQVAPPPLAAVISHALWQRRYSGDPAISGRVVELGNGPVQIVGVLAPEFEVLFPPRVNFERLPDMWVAPRINYVTANPHNVIWRVIGRLKAGATLEQARVETDTVAAALRGQHTIKETAGLYFHVRAMHDDIVREARPTLLWLMGAVGFVLLIACANVAHLLLVRASARGRELAIRAAIGGSRAQLVRQLLAESLTLAALGTAGGVAIAYGAIRALAAFGPEDLPRLNVIGIDPMILAFAVLAGLVTAVVCGVLPGLRASRPDLMDVLRTSGAPGLHKGRAVRHAVVIAEVALSLVLLVGAGLMLRSVAALQRVDPGFAPEGVLTFRLQPRGSNGEAQADFVRRVRERLAGVPGVTHVSASTGLPLDGSLANARWGLEDALADPSRYRQADVKAVLPGYFETLGTPLVAGRTFTDADEASDQRFIIIDDQLAARAFPDRPAVGQTLLSRVITPEPVTFEVIGVVRHQRHGSLAVPGADGMYFTNGYFGGAAVNNWALRTTGDPVALVGAVRSAIAQVNPRAALAQVRPMTTLTDRAMAPLHFTASLISAFAAIALVLAAVGLYGVISTIVRLRTAELGMRMILGAGRGGIFGLVIGQGLRLCVIGIAIGLALAFGVTRFMQTLLVDVTPTDPWTFGGIPVVFLTVAALACFLPALRASRLAPTAALREDKI